MVYPDVTEAELAVLQVLWEQGSSTLRHLAQSIYPNKALASGQATVAKLLERLEVKQCVARERGEGPQRFHAMVDRDVLIGRKLQSLANQLCEGSLTPLLTNLVKAGSLSARERRKLTQLLNDINKSST